jgi:hypothetical protein
MIGLSVVLLFITEDSLGFLSGHLSGIFVGFFCFFQLVIESSSLSSHIVLSSSNLSVTFFMFIANLPSKFQRKPVNCLSTSSFQPALHKFQLKTENFLPETRIPPHKVPK